MTRPKKVVDGELAQQAFKKTAELVSSFLSEPNSDVMFFDEGRFGLQSVIL